MMGPEPLAFSADQVCRLTGLSPRQLAFWDRTGFFSPAYVDEDRRRPFSRIYSFRDLVGLRTIAGLRTTVSLQELRKLGAWLKEQYQDPWANLTFYVAGGHVLFEDPETRARISAHPLGQMAFPVEMHKVAAETRAAAATLLQRGPEQIGHIQQNRYVVQNAPVLAGTRIPTAAIWDLHQADYSTAAIIAEYPRLTEQDIQAAIEYEESRTQSRSTRAG